MAWSRSTVGGGEGAKQWVTRLGATFGSLLQDEEGATLVEYILLAVLIAVAAIAGMTFLGKTANSRMNNISTPSSRPRCRTGIGEATGFLKEPVAFSRVGQPLP